MLANLVRGDWHGVVACVVASACVRRRDWVGTRRSNGRRKAGPGRQAARLLSAKEHLPQWLARLAHDWADLRRRPQRIHRRRLEGARPLRGQGDVLYRGQHGAEASRRAGRDRRTRAPSRQPHRHPFAPWRALRQQSASTGPPNPSGARRDRAADEGRRYALLPRALWLLERRACARSTATAC